MSEITEKYTEQGVDTIAALFATEPTMEQRVIQIDAEYDRRINELVIERNEAIQALMDGPDAVTWSEALYG